MSYDQTDADWDEFYYRMSDELYPGHKDQAISEFTKERLQSFYLKHPNVMRPAVDSIQEGKNLQENGHHSAALVFFVTAIEILLKATLLKPVVYGLIHNESLSEIIVKNTLGQAGFSRYEALLSKVFIEFSEIELSSVVRKGANKNLLEECKDTQELRNKIIHQGLLCSAENADHGRLVAVAVYELIVMPVLQSIGLWVGEGGIIINKD
jgi:hypothetical protein